MSFLPMLKVESLEFSGAIGIALLGFLIVLTVLAVLAIFVKFLSKIIEGFGKGKKKAKADAKPEATVIIPAASTSTATEESAVEENGLPYTPGYVTLDGVSEQDAAVIMAITSEKTGTPLENLCFRSIRRLNQDPVLENISEQDAAVIMAIVANKLDKPIENLCFNSIRLLEE